ncbi:MAG: hypothetical protein SOX92_00120 [Candidatus Onthovivens sp.]|nr:hypothetical protein [Candidatus Onthovivens sp.]
MKFTNRRIANTIIISTLLVASIASIGFSSWLIGKENSDSSNINASVGNVENNSLFTIRVVNMFTLGPDGLVEDYTIVKEASIIAIFTINNDLAYPYSNEGLLNFKVDLICSDNTFINTYIDKTPVVSNTTSVTTTLNDNTLTSDINYTITTNSGTTNVSITYKVMDKNGTMKERYNDKPTFSFVVRSK